MLNQNTSFSKLTFSISKKRKICIGTLLGCQKVSLKCTRPQIIYQKKVFFPMRTTLTLDDDLLQKAQRISGVNERGPLIHEALLALVQRESARRLAALGASDPELTDIHRRQPSPP
jgi:Arc/MetJ family transcription regulator